MELIYFLSGFVASAALAGGTLARRNRRHELELERERKRHAELEEGWRSREAHLTAHLREAWRETVALSKEFADRVATLRREGFNGGGAPPVPPPDWDPRAREFLAGVFDGGETATWVQEQRTRGMSWDDILAELQESTIGAGVAPGVVPGA